MRADSPRPGHTGHHDSEPVTINSTLPPPKLLGCRILDYASLGIGQSSLPGPRAGQVSSLCSTMGLDPEDYLSPMLDLPRGNASSLKLLHRGRTGCEGDSRGLNAVSPLQKDDGCGRAELSLYLPTF